jgi:hypothetical protein
LATVCDPIFKSVIKDPPPEGADAVAAFPVHVPAVATLCDPIFEDVINEPPPEGADAVAALPVHVPAVATVPEAFW